MRLTYQNDVIGLSAETPAEEAICALLRAADGHVFRLHAPTQRGLTHTMRKDSRTIPGVIMADIWMRIRARMRHKARAER